VFQNLDLGNKWKIICAPNSLFGEITWHYPVAGGSGENTAWVTYHAIIDQWTFGLGSGYPRSAWMDSTVLGPPIGASPSNNVVYQHEISSNADGSPMTASFTTGYFTLDEGNNKIFVDQWWPDMKWQNYAGTTTSGTVSLTFNIADYPSGPVTTIGPFPLTASTQYVSPRFRARLVSLTFSSSDLGTFWRVGNNRYRWQPDGKI
jgi:hypothetical protein